MDPKDNPAQKDDFDDAQADAFFEEFAGDGPAQPREPEPGPQDDPGQGGDAADPPRDDQGRFAAQGGEGDEGDEGQGGDDQGEDPQAELKRLRQEAQEWQHRYQSDLGRQSALQRKIQQLEEENRKLQQRGGQSTTKDGEAGDNPEGSGMSDEAWQAFKEDFPEAAQAMEQQLSTLKTHYESRLQQIESQLTPIQQQAHQQALQGELQALSERHPDYADYAAPPGVPLDQLGEKARQFQAWLQRQPQPVRDMIDSDSAADAAYLLDSFKRDSGGQQTGNQGLQQRRQRQLQAARTVPNRGGRRRSEIPDDDEDALFDYFAEKS